MIIGIDVSMLVYRGSGVANYTYNLVKNLLISDKNNEYRLFYSSLRRPKNFYYLDEFKRLGARVYSYPFPPRVLELWWSRWHIIPVEWFIGKVDWYFSSDFLRPPLMKGTKGITTIHDLTWKVFPQFHTQKIVKAHHRKIDLTIKYGDLIITDSQNTKKDLLKYYPETAKKNKIEVIYPGVDSRFRQIKDQSEIANVLKKYNILYPKRYLLYVGAIEPRKNIITAIKIFAKLIKDCKYKDFEFLIVGRAGWKNEQIFQYISNNNLKDKIKFTGFVEDEDLPYFYNACVANIYLSKYEGFGLPPVEAAACGRATLMYANSSLKELKINDCTKKGEELSSLIKIISENHNHIRMPDKFNWVKVVSQFVALFNA
ncbi:MAG: glycosyltransferase family 1 protein [Patescibacteria group bacterium]